MSAVAAWVASTVWTIPRRSVPMCSFIPKCQLFPLRVCFISGSRVSLAFFVELGAAMIVASTIVPERSNSRFSSSSPAISSKISPSARAAPEDGETEGSSSRPAPPLRPGRPARSVASTRCRRSRPRLRVRQIEPLLQEVDPQHLLQPQRLAPGSRLRIVRLDQPSVAATESPRPSRPGTARAVSLFPSDSTPSRRTSVDHPPPHLLTRRSIASLFTTIDRPGRVEETARWL